MNEIRKTLWTRIFTEGSAIVVSILLAFWIQAWWESRQDRSHERVILSTLLIEFQGMRDSLDWDTRFNEAIRDSIRKLTKASIGPENLLSDAEIDELLADLGWNQDLSTWAAPELSSVISNGDLALVTNLKLRQELGTWPIKLGFVRSTMQRDLEFFANRQMPLFAELTSLAQISNADSGTPGHPDDLYDGGRKIELGKTISHAALLPNRQFQNMLVERDQAITDILSFGFENMKESLDETMSLLEQELDSLEE